MATQNIPGLPLATGVNPVDEVWIVQNGTDKRAPVNLIAGLAQVSANVALTFQAPLQRSGNTVSLGGYVGTADNGVMYRASSAQVGVTAAGTIGQLLMGNGTGAPPSWVTAGSTGQIMLGHTGAAAGWLSAASTGQLLVATTAADPLWLAAGVSGQVLVGATGANPFWTATIPGSAGVTSFSAGTTGLTPAGATVGAMLLGGILNVVNGGTGVTAATGTGPNVVLGNQPTLVSATLAGRTTATTLTSPAAAPLTLNAVSGQTILFDINDTNVALVSAGAVLPVTDLGAVLGISSRRWSDIRTNTMTMSGALTYGGVLLSAAVTGTGALVAQQSPALITPDIGAATGTRLSLTGNISASTATALINGGAATTGYLFSSTPNFGFIGSLSAPTVSMATGTIAAVGNGTGAPYYNSGGGWSPLVVGVQSVSSFLGSNTSLAVSTSTTDLANTGSIGAANQTWLLIGQMTFDNTAAGAIGYLAIFNGTSYVAQAESTVSSLNSGGVVICCTLAILTAATTFTLRGSCNGANTQALTTGTATFAANKATGILAVRLA